MLDRILSFRSFLTPYRRRLAILGTFMLLASFSEGLGIGLFYPLLEYVQRGDVFLAQGAGRRLADVFSLLHLAPSAGAFITLIFGVILLTLLLKWGIFVLSARIYNPLMKDIRDLAFERILGSHLFHFTSSSSAALTQTLEDEVEHVGQSLNFLAVIAASSLSIVVYVAFAMSVSWKLTAVVGVVAVLRYGITGACIRRLRALGEDHSALRTRLKSVLISIHQGIDVIKCFGAEDRQASDFRVLTREIDRNATDLARAQARNAFFEGLLGDGALCVVVYLSVSHLAVSGAGLLTFLVIISRIIPKVTAINDSRIRIAEYLSRLSLLPGTLAPDGLPELHWGSTPKLAFTEAIEFRKVGFRYPSSERPALQDVDFVLRRGETLAVVGESGSGKTTLARLLLRLFDPDTGRILVDGTPLPDIRRKDWTRLVSVVGQDTFIFDDSLEANVKFGRPDCGEESYLRALRRARALEFVEALPEGHQTRLGERGVLLSGGQRQRIAIARAFLREAPILVLDEATSAMDAATERFIQDAIEELASDRTLLVIAHRFTTIRNASRILVLEAGRVCETGTHEELLCSGPLYQRFHELQRRTS